jgi:hypothetical protein
MPRTLTAPRSQLCENLPRPQRGTHGRRHAGEIISLGGTNNRRQTHVWLCLRTFSLSSWVALHMDSSDHPGKRSKKGARDWSSETPRSDWYSQKPLGAGAIFRPDASLDVSSFICFRCSLGEGAVNKQRNCPTPTGPPLSGSLGPYLTPSNLPKATTRSRLKWRCSSPKLFHHAAPPRSSRGKASKLSRSNLCSARIVQLYLQRMPHVTVSGDYNIGPNRGPKTP